MNWTKRRTSSRTGSPHTRRCRAKARYQESGSVWYAITVKDYENLSVNLEELRRYIIEQQMLLQYYEEAITKNSDEINTEEAE